MAAKDTDDTRNDELEADDKTVSQASIKKMIAQAKDRGYITYEQLNKALPPDQVSSEQIEDVMSMLSEMGVNVVEDDDEGDGDDAKGGELVEVAGARDVAVSTSSSGETLDRTDDPVRMYLREMGSVELLSREGEIAIAKRIEAGRNTMIAGLCESPLTFQAITIWRDELLNEDVLLRDVIDLETTFGNSLEGEDGVPVAEGLTDTAAQPKPSVPPNPNWMPTATRLRPPKTMTRKTISPTCRFRQWKLRSNRACWKHLTGLPRITSVWRQCRMRALMPRCAKRANSATRRKRNTRRCAARSWSLSPRCICTTTGSKRWLTSFTGSTVESCPSTAPW